MCQAPHQDCHGPRASSLCSGATLLPPPSPVPGPPKRPPLPRRPGESQRARLRAGPGQGVPVSSGLRSQRDGQTVLTGFPCQMLWGWDPRGWGAWCGEPGEGTSATQVSLLGFSHYHGSEGSLSTPPTSHMCSLTPLALAFLLSYSDGCWGLILL